MTHTPSTLSGLLSRPDIEPSRALGQNFVIDPNTVRRIARLADVDAGDHVVEIGAGLGSLTLALVETGAKVTAIERDRRLLPLLNDVVDGLGVDVVEADAMGIDWSELLGTEQWTLVANLPYNVATPLVLDLLIDAPQIETFLVMVQLEAAERMAAAAGSRVYGIPSVKVAYWATPEIVGRVSPEVFLPKPRVESALLKLTRHDRQPADLDARRLYRLVEQGFGQRRKMLRKALAGSVTAEQLERAGVDGTERAEALDLTQWIALTRAVGGEQ